MTRANWSTRMRWSASRRGRGVWIGLLAGLVAWSAGGAAENDGRSWLEMRAGNPVVLFESGTDSYHRVFAAGYLEGAGAWRLTNVLGGVEGWQSWTDAVPARSGFYAVERWGWEALVDSDGDGMPDGWELRHRLGAMEAGDADEDADGDGLANINEYRLGTDPREADTDGDGLDDRMEADFGTNPLQADSDGDGLPDGWEIANGLNPVSDGGAAYGLVAWWRMDGGLENAAGTAWPGRMRGTGEAVWAPGRGAGGALRLDGNRQYVSVAEMNAEGTLLDGGPFTVTWVCKFDAEDAPVLAALGGEMVSASKGWRVRFEGTGTSRLAWSMGNGEVVKSSPLATAEELSEWTDVALTWDGTNAWGYINGVEVAGGKRIAGFADPAAGEMLIGACQLNLDKSYWKGWIDDVRVYRRSLSAAELGEVNDWLGDADGDGLSNGREYVLETHPLRADTDEDGLGDAGEVALGTNPLSPDTDGDGMPDGWEVANQLDPLADDADGDADGDGSTNYEEYMAGTDPQVPETAEEDSDGDGMPDAWEIANGLNPQENDANGDADADGLTNSEEYVQGTNPLSADTDADGLDDGWEVANGLNPLSGDTDRDGMSDSWEVANGLKPQEYDAVGDADGDVLENIDEYRLGTDPQSPDTDGDGLEDGWEVVNGLNPLVPDAP